MAENYEDSGEDNEHCENFDKKGMANGKCDFCFFFVQYSDETRKTSSWLDWVRNTAQGAVLWRLRGGAMPEAVPARQMQI